MSWPDELRQEVESCYSLHVLPLCFAKDTPLLHFFLFIFCFSLPDFLFSLLPFQRMVRMEQEQKWGRGCSETKAQGGAVNTVRDQVPSTPCKHKWSQQETQAEVLSSWLTICSTCVWGKFTFCHLDLVSQTPVAMVNQSVCPPAIC